MQMDVAFGEPKEPRRREGAQPADRVLTSDDGLSRRPSGLSQSPTRSSSEFAAEMNSENAPLGGDMDTHNDAYRRQKPRARVEGGIDNKRQGNKNKPSLSGLSNQSRADGLESDFSSVTASDDVELEHLEAEDALSNNADEETSLTKKSQRKRNWRRRRRNADLDASIGASSSPKHDQRLADRKVLMSLLINAALIGLWYIFSLSISLYNTWMFSPKHLDFNFPLFTTCVHMLVQFMSASLVLYFIPRLRPGADRVMSAPDSAHVDTLRPERPIMTWMFYLTRCAPCGAATGLDIGLGNMSLEFITLTFYTMCKSSSLAFVLSFAFLFRLEKPSLKLILVITTMTIGVVMMVAGEAEFVLKGFILVMLAAFFSGFRWSLTQILLLRSPATSNPFSSIFFLAPAMFVSLAVIAIPVEGFKELGEGLTKLRELKGLFMGICILLFPGLLAFLMTASEFALLQRTSVVTLSICGIFKEVVTISAAAIVFHDPLTPINVSGLLITIASIAAYNYLKIVTMRREAAAEAENLEKGEEGSDFEEEAEEPMLRSSERFSTTLSASPNDDDRPRASFTNTAKSARDMN